MNFAPGSAKLWPSDTSTFLFSQCSYMKVFIGWLVYYRIPSSNWQGLGLKLLLVVDECMWIVLCERLASHPGFIPTSYPLLPGQAFESVRLWPGIKHLLRVSENTKAIIRLWCSYCISFKRNQYSATVYISYLDVTQKRMGLLLSQVPLKVPSSCHFREFFHASVIFGLLIRELNLYPICKAVLWPFTLLKAPHINKTELQLYIFI